MGKKGASRGTVCFSGYFVPGLPSLPDLKGTASRGTVCFPIHFVHDG